MLACCRPRVKQPSRSISSTWSARASPVLHAQTHLTCRPHLYYTHNTPVHLTCITHTTQHTSRPHLYYTHTTHLYTSPVLHTPVHLTCIACINKLDLTCITHTHKHTHLYTSPVLNTPVHLTCITHTTHLYTSPALHNTPVSNRSWPNPQ